MRHRHGLSPTEEAALAVDLSVLDAYDHRGHGPRCGIAKLLDEEGPLEQGTREILAAALESTRTSAAIARWLRAEGQQVRDQTISRHRGKECACG